MKMLDERLATFHTEIMAIMVDHILSFHEFRACGALKLLGEKGPIASRRWLVDMVKTFRTSFCPEGLKVKFSSCILKNRARD